MPQLFYIATQFAHSNLPAVLLPKPSPTCELRNVPNCRRIRKNGRPIYLYLYICVYVVVHHRKIFSRFLHDFFESLGLVKIGRSGDLLLNLSGNFLYVASKTCCGKSACQMFTVAASENNGKLFVSVDCFL